MSSRMRKVIQDILTKNKMTFGDLKKEGYVKIKNDPYMDLNIDYLGEECEMDKYSVAHNFVQMGDLMADPDMTFFHFGAGSDIQKFDQFYPSTWQLDSLEKFQIAVDCVDGSIRKNPQLARELITFANDWATNIRRHGFIKGECFLSDKRPCKDLKKQ